MLGERVAKPTHGAEASSDLSAESRPKIPSDRQTTVKRARIHLDASGQGACRRHFWMIRNWRMASIP